MLRNIKSASSRISNATRMLESTIADIDRGKGTLGYLMSDEGARLKAEQAIRNLHSASEEANSMMARIDSIAGAMQAGMDNKAGIMNLLVKDTGFVAQLNRSMSSIESGTAAFSEDMEALKHNFLTRPYFRRQEKKNKASK